MRLAALVALAIVAVVLTPAGAGARRERPEGLAPLLGALRGARIAPRARSVEPRRIYVVVSALTPERRAALEAAGLTIELPVAAARS